MVTDASYFKITHIKSQGIEICNETFGTISEIWLCATAGSSGVF